MDAGDDGDDGVDENDMGWVVEDNVENGSCDEEDEINPETSSNEAMDVNNDAGEREEDEGEKEEEFLQNQDMEVSFPVQTASRSVWDIIAGEDPQKKKQIKLKSCTACGKEGHAWPTCRRKNVEFMLLKIGAMQAPKKLDNHSPALLAVVEDVAPATKQKTRKREVSSLAEGVEFEAAAAHVVSGSKKPKSDDGSSLVCGICGEQPVGNWRISGRKCVCGKFAHSQCWVGKRNGAVVCTDCESQKK
jgi:hypothetical protein